LTGLVPDAAKGFDLLSDGVGVAGDECHEGGV
jgi:hypothetical protein